MDWNSYQYNLDLADQAIQEGKLEIATEIFDKLFKDDKDGIHLYAMILTESNPEYSLHSKELVKFAEKYNIDKVLSKLDKKINDNKGN